jgi:hypothetical protein
MSCHVATNFEHTLESGSSADVVAKVIELLQDYVTQ